MDIRTHFASRVVVQESVAVVAEELAREKKRRREAESKCAELEKEVSRLKEEVSVRASYRTESIDAVFFGSCLTGGRCCAFVGDYLFATTSVQGGFGAQKFHVSDFARRNCIGSVHSRPIRCLTQLDHTTFLSASLDKSVAAVCVIECVDIDLRWSDHA